MPQKKKKKPPISKPYPIEVPLPPKPTASRGVILRALADLLRFIADGLVELARRE
jgi:hypothetical protein